MSDEKSKQNDGDQWNAFTWKMFLAINKHKHINDQFNVFSLWHPAEICAFVFIEQMNRLRKVYIRGVCWRLCVLLAAGYLDIKCKYKCDDCSLWWMNMRYFARLVILIINERICFSVQTFYFFLFRSFLVFDFVYRNIYSNVVNCL